MADIVHIAALEYPLDHKIGPQDIVQLFEIYIPEDAFVEYRFLFFGHGTKIHIFQITILSRPGC